MKAFIYKGELYLRCIPGKALFRSTMVHEVVNRGDIFAMNVNTQEFTVISGKTQCTQIEVNLGPLSLTALQEMLDETFKPANEKPVDKTASPEYTVPSKSQKRTLQQLALDLAAPKFAIGDMVRLKWWTERSALRVVGVIAGSTPCYTLQGLPIPYPETDIMKVATHGH